ncbi:SUMF1/EgtB/PvdO family nonheme iron enzyme [Candidatus Entotheonella palauensis]|uniref:SUMF1/EgtB/PvdO family nonheme iron enzyme n=1 Tax=Candidatus Entotheonella palauensis TaxID=93172 RepID=UPI00277B4C99|nr:SUMF1/EgtB/PvdO family nonheme iron enzyme [Candidatus Entotheonella palauensis]
MVRGGSWNNDAENLRAANRNRNAPEDRNDNLGFRCVRPPVMLCRASDLQA